MMVIEKAHITKHSEYVQWHPVPYSHAEAVRKIREAITASSSSLSGKKFGMRLSSAAGQLQLMRAR